MQGGPSGSPPGDVHVWLMNFVMQLTIWGPQSIFKCPSPCFSDSFHVSMPQSMFHCSSLLSQSMFQCLSPMFSASINFSMPQSVFASPGPRGPGSGGPINTILLARRRHTRPPHKELETLVNLYLIASVLF